MSTARVDGERSLEKAAFLARMSSTMHQILSSLRPQSYVPYAMLYMPRPVVAN